MRITVRDVNPVPPPPPPVKEFTLTLSEREMQIVERALRRDYPKEGAQSRDNDRAWGSIRIELDVAGIPVLRETA